MTDDDRDQAQKPRSIVTQVVIALVAVLILVVFLRALFRWVDPPPPIIGNWDADFFDGTIPIGRRSI